MAGKPARRKNSGTDVLPHMGTQRAALDTYIQEQSRQRSPQPSEEDRQDIELIRKARKEPRVPWEKVKRDLGL